MLKKLTEEQQQSILESAIEEFGSKGLERAQISSIAKKAGISVGVIYKYYENKDALIDTCLRHSVDILKSVLREAVSGEKDLFGACEKLVRTCVRFSRENARYIEMYHAVTMSAARRQPASRARSRDPPLSSTWLCWRRRARTEPSGRTLIRALSRCSSTTC